MILITVKFFKPLIEFSSLGEVLINLSGNPEDGCVISVPGFSVDK